MSNGFRSSISADTPDLKSTLYGLHILKMMDGVSEIDVRAATNYITSYCSDEFKLNISHYKSNLEAVNYGLQLLTILRASTEYLSLIYASKRLLESIYKMSNLIDLFYSNPRELFYFVNSLSILKSLIHTTLDLNEFSKSIIEKIYVPPETYIEDIAYMVFVLKTLYVEPFKIKPLLDSLKKFLNNHHYETITPVSFEKIWLCKVALASYGEYVDIDIDKALLPYLKSDGGFNIRGAPESNLEDTWKALTLFQILPKKLNVRVFLMDEDTGDHIPQADLKLPSGRSIPVKNGDMVLIPEGQYDVGVEAERYLSRRVTVKIEKEGGTLQLLLKLRRGFAPYGRELVLDNTRFESSTKLVAFISSDESITKKVDQKMLIEWVEKYGLFEDLTRINTIINRQSPTRKVKEEDFAKIDVEKLTICFIDKIAIKIEERIKCDNCGTEFHLMCLVKYNETYMRKNRDDGSLILFCPYCHKPVVEQVKIENREKCPICEKEDPYLKTLQCIACGQKIHIRCLKALLSTKQKDSFTSLYCPKCKKLMPIETLQ
ncbi:MAG: hypothetical protein QXR19_14385 [Candidatus Jordarchaeaceae archaeon]